MRLRYLGLPRVQFVVREKPRILVYVRAEPVTARRPTPAQAEARMVFAEAARTARLLGPEGVAELVGGEVVEVEGTRARWIRLPDGRILPPQNALVWWRMRGWRSPRTRVYKIPRWFEETARYALLPSPPATLKPSERRRLVLGAEKW